MLTKAFYSPVLLLFLSFSVNAQLQSRLFERLPAPAGAASAEALQVAECEPDSILGYGFLTLTDSVLGQKQIFHRYGDMATTIYTYQEPPGLPLYRIDSTVFDVEGRGVFHQVWELDEVANAVVPVERTFGYPHDGTVVADPLYYLFLPIQQFFDPATIRGNEAVYDSLIFHEADFFSGVLEPAEKTVSIFAPDGRRLEVLTYSWDSFNSSWLPSTRSLSFYTMEGKPDYAEDYLWAGSEFILDQVRDYVYDDNDSLRLVLGTDGETGVSVEKVEFTYDTEEKAYSATDSIWDNDAGEWIFLLSFHVDVDDQGRLESSEVFLQFFGLIGIRQEYEYLGDSPCPWLSRAYESEDGENWEFIANYYYFPNVTTSVLEPPSPAWKAYPNPASEGIWLEAPPGIPVEITDLNGRRLYQGVAKGREFITLPPSISGYVVLTAGQGKAASSRLILMER